MRCEACHGRGAVRVTKQAAARGLLSAAGGVIHISEDGSTIELSCSECNGSGVAHCCDGICSQPQMELGAVDRASPDRNRFSGP